jgi:2'-5' RNA ligase
VSPGAANWFIGLPVPDDGWLPRALDGAPRGLRRFGAADLHATVAFLGDVDEAAARRAWSLAQDEAVPRLAGRLTTISALGGRRVTAFSVLLDSPGLADWMGRVRGDLLEAAGARPDDRPPLPHVTVARPGRRPAPALLPEATDWATARPSLEHPVQLRSLALYTWAPDRRQRLFQIVEERPVGPGRPRRLTGGCHCGAVRFAATARSREVLDCNCSICRKRGLQHLIVPPEDFELLAGAEKLRTYTFHTGVARHHFCDTCGITPFYRPRSHPTDYDVNARCLDEPAGFRVVPFDGANWEANVASIR